MFMKNINDIHSILLYDNCQIRLGLLIPWHTFLGEGTFCFAFMEVVIRIFYVYHQI